MVNFFTHKISVPFSLELGGWLPEVELAYTTYGTINAAQDNVVWVCHAFTGNANPADWWSGLVGERRWLNPQDHFIICVNILGSHYGSTNSMSINPQTQFPYFHDFPTISIRDNINGFIHLRKHLGISKIKILLGGSLGGQQALEWAIMEPDVIENLALFSTNAIHSPWGIALNETQRMAIRNDPGWLKYEVGAGMEGMKVARAIALLSYRNYQTYDRTQSRDMGQVDFFRANTYQNYQGEKLSRRFNAFSYYCLTKMFDSHDIGRGRTSVEEALALVKAKTLVVGIGSDILFPPIEQIRIANGIPNALYHEIASIYGHDGFLIEYDELVRILKSTFSSI